MQTKLTLDCMPDFHETGDSQVQENVAVYDEVLAGTRRSIEISSAALAEILRRIEPYQHWGLNE